MSIARARSLRKAMPEAEKQLWRLLRRKQLEGFRFRRQHPVSPHVLDFYCYAERLAVELDGWQHAEDAARVYDARRDAVLAGQGIRVLRFWNEDVYDHADDVVYAIWHELTGASREAGADPPSVTS